jgi:hypothetical protein
LKQYSFKKERYEEHKAKIFVIVKGQCTLNMKNKVESLQGYDSNNVPSTFVLSKC